MNDVDSRLDAAISDLEEVGGNYRVYRDPGIVDYCLSFPRAEDLVRIRAELERRERSTFPMRDILQRLETAFVGVIQPDKMARDAYDEIIRLRAALEGCFILPAGVDHPTLSVKVGQVAVEEVYRQRNSLLARRDKAQKDIANLEEELAWTRSSFENACALVAKMHAAAMGKVCGPVVGPVEDVAALREKVLALEKRVESQLRPCGWPDCIPAKEAIESHNLQLAAISAATFQNTESSVKNRIRPDNPYYTGTYVDVCRAVNREMELRKELEALRSKDPGPVDIPDDIS